jgi:hypothetical protein
MPRSPQFACLLSLACAPLLALGCGSSNAGPVGGPVMGALDSHCTVSGVKTKTETGMCIDLRVPMDAATSGDAGGDAGATATSNDGGESTTPPTADCAGMQSGGGDFGATMCNSEGDDDDCKYHVAWTSSPIRQNKDVFFDVTATKLFDGMPALGADIQIEAFLTDTQPTPSVNIVTNESTGVGKYHIGPVQFNASGKWTVRFHLYQFCADTTDDSPHGHAAFYINVP